MMITAYAVRRLSTTTVKNPLVNQWLNALQSRSSDEQQTNLERCIKHLSNAKDSERSKFVTDLMHRWALERPNAEALWTCGNHTHECQKLTFDDVYTRSSRLADVLTGPVYNLKEGKTALVLLPRATTERILLQLACLQSGLSFYSYNPNKLTDIDIRQRIRTVGADCLIVSNEHFDKALKGTQNPLRPLLKCVLDYNSSSTPIPVGWHHLTRSIHDIESTHSKSIVKKEVTFIARPVTSKKSPIDLGQWRIACWLMRNSTNNKLPNLIWANDEDEKISFAPWLFGSALFCKEANDIETILNTFSTYPIDTFCASPVDYQRLESDIPINKNKLTQLLSIGEITDPIVKERWYKLTNLHIHEDYDGLETTPSQISTGVQVQSTQQYLNSNQSFDEEAQIDSTSNTLSKKADTHTSIPLTVQSSLSNRQKSTESSAYKYRTLETITETILKTLPWHNVHASSKPQSTTSARK